MTPDNPESGPSGLSATERIYRTGLDAWKSRIEERLDAQEQRLTKVDELLVEIKVHLAKIDTNVAWFVKVLKWVGGLIAPAGTLLYKLTAE